MSPAINVNLDGDHERVGRAVGTDRLPIIHTTADWTLDAMEKGMQSGATSVMLLIPARTGPILRTTDLLLAAETSLTMWMSAATMLAAKFRDEVERPGWAILSSEARAVFLPRLAEGIRRAIPSATAEQASEAAGMVLDAFGADAPPGWWEG